VLYAFETCTLDLTRGCLRVADQEVGLRPKSFDVLRYLVENAGRLISKDEIMKAVWPHVVVTDESLLRCISEVRAAIGDREQRIIKTVPRRGYLFSADLTRQATDDRTMSRLAASAPKMIPDKPSIAVLAFNNLSGDPGQEYFSDGITEDIITELSRFSELFVIARNSSFQYKGKSLDVRQVGRELGVRYVLEGGIRRAGDRVRISAQLVDAVTGAHRWAERYDRKLDDVFAVQDEVARTIVATLAVYVNKAEAERARSKPPTSWQAHDYYMRAADNFGAFWSSFRVEELYEAQRHLACCLSADPKYARAHAMLSHTYMAAALNPLDDNFMKASTFDRAHQLAVTAVQLDSNLPQAHAILGIVLTWKRQHDAAIAAFEKAIALNPNFTEWRYAAVLIFAGEFGRAIDVIDAHIRLDPFYPPQMLNWLGLTRYMLRQYSEALPPLRECISRVPDYPFGHIVLAATYAQLGKSDAAQAEAAEVLRIHPKLTIVAPLRRLGVFKDPEDAAHYFEGLRKAGLPEGDWT
jgi:adenylate cyclase